jgi:Ca-activated chloride channel family protein
VVRAVWPYVIVALLAVVIVTVLYLSGGPQPAGRRDPGLLRRRSRWRRWVPVLPLLAAVGCLALAFSGFRLNFQESSPIAMLAMDISDSMNATDIEPDRLTAAQQAAREFVEQLPTSFQVGLVTFAHEARLVESPTQDHGKVLSALDRLETSLGTVIGDGLVAALDAIEEERASDEELPAAVLLLSDGRDLGSTVEPDVAAGRAQVAGVPVYTVLVGEAGEEGEEGAADAETLERVAATSGGEAFTATTRSQLIQRFSSIGSQLSVDLDVQPSATPLVVAALGLVIVAGFLLVLTPR